MPVDNPAPADLKKTPLHDLHVALGARMVPFAGYAMPVQYPPGIMAEHTHTRAAAGLFDVSHMGQVRVAGGAPQTAIERLVPGDIAGLSVNRMRYTQFTNDQGGILDDLMVTRRERDLFVVVNAACKDDDFARMQAGLTDCSVEMLANRALLALQGPQAVAVLSALAPAVAAMPFMSYAEVTLAGAPCLITRSGYTGEDGYEISVPDEAAERLAKLLLADERVKPIGLGARDSLRLEAGLCLYGHDIDTTTTPIEAGLAWSIGKRRRTEGGFPGAAIIQKQLAEGPARRRVGIRPDGRAPAREHTPITDAAGATVGEITSGGFGPSVNAPVAMGYVPAALANPDTPLNLVVRGKPLPARVVTLPFITKRYAT
jgi:aminomethyltransferase